MKTLETLTAVPSAVEQRKFSTDNPRHCRILALLLQRPAKREEIDNRAGASNGPDLVLELRRRGLELPCERVTAIDRDGRECRPGIYSMTTADRRKVLAWLRRREGGFIAPELSGLLVLAVVAVLMLLGGA